MLNRLKPVEFLSLIALGMLLALTAASSPSLPHWPWLAARFLLLAAAILSLAALPRKAGTFASVLRDFLPVAVIPVIFDSLGDLIPWVRDRLYDDLLIRIDLALFGAHPTIVLERMVSSQLTTALQFAYISYYPMAIVLGVTLAAKSKRLEFDEALFGIVLCFYLSYAGYVLVPAVGPRFTLAHLQTMGLEAAPLVLAIQTTLNTLENTKMDAFPSGHTAVAIMTLYYAWKSREKLLAGVLAPLVAALVFSTVYLRYHYVIDVIAGMGLTLVTVLLAPRIRRALSRSSGQPYGKFHEAP